MLIGAFETVFVVCSSAKLGKLGEFSCEHGALLVHGATVRETGTRVGNRNNECMFITCTGRFYAHLPGMTSLGVQLVLISK